MLSVFLLACTAVSAAVPAAPPAAPPAVVRERPDIVFISFDTLRRDHVSCFGHERLTTPFVDAVARTGVLFEDCQAVIPVTGPSHISMFSGVHAQTHGAFRNGTKLDAARVTLPQLLADVGYRTHAVVSGWTLKDRMCGLARCFGGYDESGMDQRVNVVTTMRTADDVTDAALGWADEVTKSADRPPFFLFVHYFDPHEPYAAPNSEVPGPNPLADGGPDLEKHTSALADYDREIAYTDGELGRLLTGLRERGLLDDAVTVFTADHGQSFGEHGYGKAEGAHGRRAYQSGLAVPLVIAAPGRIPGGRVSELPVTHLDLLPTLADLAGVPVETWPRDLHGRSLAEVLADPSAPPPWGTALRRRYGIAFSGATGNKWNFFRWMQNKEVDAAKPQRYAVLRGRDRKVIVNPRKKHAVECYDLVKDPGELTPLTCSARDLGEVAKLAEWYDRTRGEAGERELTEQDLEALESLGYIGTR